MSTVEKVSVLLRRSRRRKSASFDRSVMRLAVRQGAMTIRPDEMTLRRCGLCGQPVVPLSEPDEPALWERLGVPHAAALTCAPCVAESAVESK